MTAAEQFASVAALDAATHHAVEVLPPLDPPYQGELDVPTRPTVSPWFRKPNSLGGAA
ncbi:hypothetical protein GCM10022243_49260 [Saccharothrix violaceirubra]|uniref:Uncharacterized protein n=1 Tax=Saccharothrix violaceirubra TaxID=413306 RepID=A0A7W7SZI1_9PSEU|nr:hypothetical protein [Saccharothrix violaceirubra]MBB4963730.1 hypothetical protein [Saccharothrix violaceirubra]